MKHSTLVGAALAGVLLASVAPGSPGLAQSRRGARRSEPRVCVAFSQQRSSDERSISMSLENRCSREVESTISWRLVCGDSHSSTPIVRVEHMNAREHRVVVASPDACGTSSYRIEDIQWSWRATGEP
jgi:hypothetical protein